MAMSVAAPGRESSGNWIFLDWILRWVIIALVQENQWFGYWAWVVHGVCLIDASCDPTLDGGGSLASR
jgi:hypothetical protein